MKERPILFSGPMVRAILENRKRMTRRLKKLERVNARPDDWLSPTLDYNGEWVFTAEHGLAEQVRVRCPYGVPGDRLWVRENGWERPERTPKMMREGADTWEPYYFDADGLSEQYSDDLKAWGFKRRTSIHMPRWASRITLEVTAVRVERLCYISEADAIAEGVTIPDYDRDMQPVTIGGFTSGPARIAFKKLWISINGESTWYANPWVWVVEFRRITP